MIPIVKINEASSPAIGFKASAACAEVAMLVTPLAFNVAAVVIMIETAIRLEKPIPDGSSSDAPVIRPGPKTPSRRGLLDPTARLGSPAVDIMTGFFGLGMNAVVEVSRAFSSRGMLRLSG